MTQAEADTGEILGADNRAWLRGYMDRMLNRGKPEYFDEYTRGYLSAEGVLWAQEISRDCAEMRERLYGI